jgi:hypothetical protein
MAMNLHLLCYALASAVGVAVVWRGLSAGIESRARVLVAFMGVMILCWSGVGLGYNLPFISAHIPLGLYPRINAFKCLCLGAAAGIYLALVVTKQMSWFLSAPGKKE